MNEQISIEGKQELSRVDTFLEALKALAAVGGGLFFLLRIMEWNYVSGFYETLGVSSLITMTLESAPGKYGIGVYLEKEIPLIYLSINGAILGWLIHKISPFVIENATTQILQGTSWLKVAFKVCITIGMLMFFMVVAIITERRAIFFQIGFTFWDSVAIAFFVACFVYAIMELMKLLNMDLKQIEEMRDVVLLVLFFSFSFFFHCRSFSLA